MKKKKSEKKRRAKGNPQPAAAVFGVDYFLEYNTGILAVTEPRESYTQGRKTKLYAFRQAWGLLSNSHFDFCKI